MTVRVAINGYGRIGRNILRALYERGLHDRIRIVAINDLGEAKVHAHLTRYDSVHGVFPHEVGVDGDRLCIEGERIPIFSERDPHKLPWQRLKVDVVFECTGHFTARAQAAAHLEAGAKRVIVSAPGKEMDATVVYGVNHRILNDRHRIISNASCTTNCLAPVAWVLHRRIGIESGQMTTIHAYTNDQHLTDLYHDDLYRARSATQSMIPTKTGAAAAVGLVLPELAGKLDGMAVRVPTINVSLVDFNFIASRATDAAEVNGYLAQAAAGELHGILAYNELPLVSIDFNHNPASSIVDAAQTKVQGQLVKVMAWYDNEWGFANRMLDVVMAWCRR